MEVRFYNTVDDALLEFAVIIARYQGKWIYCKHKQRDTYEIPGGHREPGETILEAAKRELYDETGAVSFTIRPICVYSVTGKNRVNETGAESFGMLYAAEVDALEQTLHNEMEKIVLLDGMPAALTYPDIQPQLLDAYRKWQEKGE